MRQLLRGVRLYLYKCMRWDHIECLAFDRPEHWMRHCWDLCKEKTMRWIGSFSQKQETLHLSLLFAMLSWDVKEVSFVIFLSCVWDLPEFVLMKTTSSAFRMSNFIITFCCLLFDLWDFADKEPLQLQYSLRWHHCDSIICEMLQHTYSVLMSAP